MDQAGGHTAHDVAVPANVIRWFLPPHSPALNPVEQIWQWLRDQQTWGVLFHDREALVATRCQGRTALMDDPARVRSLTGGPTETEDDRFSA